MSFHDLKTNILAQIPLIGPHSGIEGELLLLGKKPLGWICIISDNDPRPYMSNPDVVQARDLQRRLDEAVKEGRLKSIDVVIRDYVAGDAIKKSIEKGWLAPTGFLKYDTDGKPYEERIFRHYCQPGREGDLKLVAAFNQKAFAGLGPIDLPKPMGDYLGYRKRDQMLWALLGNSKNSILRPVRAVIIGLGSVAKPAYQERMLKAPRKPAASSARRSSHDGTPQP